MPKYKADIEYIIRWEDFKKLWNTATTRQDRCLITLFWVTGGRPTEVLNLKKKDIKINEGSLEIIIDTAKLGKKGKFIVRKRSLRIHCDTELLHLKVLYRYLENLKADDSLLFNISRQTMNNIIKRLGYDALNKNICPYNFRHSRMTLLAEKGIGREELMRFKGARTIQSVTPYDHARKIDYDIAVEI